MSDQIEFSIDDQVPLTEGSDPVDSFSIEVYGMPAPQGSKRAILHKTTGRPIVVESSAKVKPWREDVKWSALTEREQRRHTTFEAAVAVLVHFRLPRPKGHYGTGRNAGIVKPAAPARPTVKPDLDKLARSTLDALKEARVYRDDSQVVELLVAKSYGDPGATIRVYAL